jgi:hypothetical protein
MFKWLRDFLYTCPGCNQHKGHLPGCHHSPGYEALNAELRGRAARYD